jgi:hypothetical protein
MNLVSGLENLTPPYFKSLYENEPPRRKGRQDRKEEKENHGGFG